MPHKSNPSARACSLIAAAVTKGGQCGTGQTERGPLRHRPGAEALVKADRRLIPVEHRPLEAAALPLHRHCGKLRQQPAADTVAPELRSHVQILEIDTASSQERRVVVEEE